MPLVNTRISRSCDLTSSIQTRKRAFGARNTSVRWKSTLLVLGAERSLSSWIDEVKSQLRDILC